MQGYEVGNGEGDVVGVLEASEVGVRRGDGVGVRLLSPSPPFAARIMLANMRSAA
ncbi:hypothetical protein ACFU6S_21855 [Streptomyces sp. NPDC057456]|uniref:hypothetical protein n=1 Tax=Streptomyces sp. NPDC057456 TaxID=3346139 RepID=UPI0036D15848